MAEPIIEQILDWINDKLDGVHDPDTTLTLRSVRPKIIDWSTLQFIHGDVIIELASVENASQTTVESAFKTATVRLNCIVTTLPADTAADTFLCRMFETVRRTILSGYGDSPKLGGLAINMSCPLIELEPIDGGVDAVVTCKVEYATDLFDGYPS